MDIKVNFSGRAIKYTEDEIAVVVEAMRNAEPLTQGKHLQAFQKAFGEYIGAEHCFAVMNGVSALELSAQLCNFKPGDEVVIPSHTFTASAYPYAKKGAKLVWADVDPVTHVVNAETIEKCITPKTKAIVVVHLYGYVADMPAIMEVAKRHNVLVIEDAAQSIGADIDGIKKTVITTLGAAFPSMRILTNDTGILYLDTLKDADGNYLLKQDPTQPATFRLRCGTRTLEVTNAPDFLIPNGEGGKVPFIVGDLNEGIEFFDRKMMSVKGSDVASVENFNAFANDGMIYRALLRHDVRQRDEDSFVSGYITG